MEISNQPVQHWSPWNKGRLVGQKPPLKLQEIWAIRVRLQIANHRRDLALLNLAIDSKLKKAMAIQTRLVLALATALLLCLLLLGLRVRSAKKEASEPERDRRSSPPAPPQHQAPAPPPPQP